VSDLPTSGSIPLLRLDEVSVRYGTGRHALQAVDGVSFELPRGGTLGLVGESGSGKSTVAKAIVGLALVAGGRVVFDGADCTSNQVRSGADYRRRVQMVFQDPYASLNPRMTVTTLLADVLARRPDVPRSARRKEAERLLTLVGLPSSALTRYPHQFSGGQRQRIAIARALAVDPELIIMDEVTSALDVSVQATILNLLRDLQREFSLSYLFISHDLSVIGAMSDRVAVMYMGRIVELGDTKSVFETACHPYTRALLASVPRFGEGRNKAPLSGDMPDPHNPPLGCRFHTRCPVGPVTHPERLACIENDPSEDAEARPHQAACHYVG
jgi:oligopeptide/dipeptide ABC transporter ATP-binding protein